MRAGGAWSKHVAVVYPRLACVHSQQSPGIGRCVLVVVVVVAVAEERCRVGKGEIAVIILIIEEGFQFALLSVPSLCSLYLRGQIAAISVCQ